MSVRAKIVEEGGEPFPFEFEFIELPRKGDVVDLGQPYAYDVLGVTLHGVMQGDDPRQMSVTLTVAPVRP